MGQQQRINLYEETLRPVQDWVDAVVCIRVVIVAVLVLGLATIQIKVQADTFAKEVAAVAEEEAEMADRLKRLARKYPLPKKDPELAKQIDQLKEDIATWSKVQELLFGRRMGNRKGFSSHFSQLAAQRYPHLRLTQVDFLDGGRNLVIGGRAEHNQAILDFVKQLSKKPDFQKKVFPYFQLDRVAGATPAQPMLTNFVLSTNLQGLQVAVERNKEVPERVVGAGDSFVQAIEQANQENSVINAKQTAILKGISKK
ncbi:MAG: hypothetical protein HQL52_04835 [Magnetococcales bacterium]|nr:hypothetical protein [Magnetococcales bacterium]